MPSAHEIRPVFALLVGFDFDQGTSPANLPPLGGMVNDVIAWWRLLRGMGVPAAHVAMITDQPVDALARRLADAGLADDDLINGGLHRATDDTSMWQARKAFSARVVATDAEARAVDGRMVVAWSGHGGVIRDGGAEVPVLYLPDGQHRAVMQVMTVAPLLAANLGEGAGPPRVLAFIGACHSGAELFSDIDHDTVLTSAKFGIPCLAASSRDAVAHEIEVDGVRRGAMAWAATTVLSRFEPRPDGSLALSYAELYHRMRSVLTAIDVKDEPLLFVPSGELNRNILRLSGDKHIGGHVAKAGDPIEIYPTNGWHVAFFECEDVNKKSLGKMVVVGPNVPDGWKNKGYVPSSTAFTNGVPDQTFTASFQSDVNMQKTTFSSTHPDLSSVHAYTPSGTWAQSTGTLTPTFEISGGPDTAYMDVQTTKLVFYSDAKSAPETIATSNNSTLTFTLNTQPVQPAWTVSDA